ncbi:MAG TPA: VCBS repeat-containing protein [Candidatus Acidoferrales bacterium]|nr:VCBS repeat-containing protein [Candidatus Acidoferrales bacterium]
MVWLGNGNGTFSPTAGSPVTVAACATANPLAVADFNGDGKLDLAIPDGVNGAPTNSGGVDSPPVAVFLGNGDGMFTRVPNCCGTPGLQAHNVLAADLNNDGKLDLAISIANNPGSFQAALEGAPPVYIQVFLGKGDGTFQSTDYSMLLPSSPSLSGGDGTMGLYADDLNSDGKLDFVTGDIFNYGAAGYEISVLTQTPPPAQSPDFTIAPANASVSVTPGATATDNIQIASINGFLGGGVSLAVTGCPATVTCNVSLPQGAIVPSSTGSFPLTIATQACTTAGALPTSPPFLRLLAERWTLFAWFALALILMWTAIIPQRRKARLGDHVSRRRRLLPWAAVALAGLAIGGCNASSMPSQKTPSCVGGTPAGTYTINVSAASQEVTHSTTVALAVQ